MREYPLYTPYGHAGIVVDCPYDRTMFECILVLSLSYLYVHAGIAVGCSCCRCMFESVLVMWLSTPPVHAGVAAACPCGRTLRSWSDVLPCGDAARMGTQAALTTILYVSDTPDNNRTRTIVYC